MAKTRPEAPAPVKPNGGKSLAVIEEATEPVALAAPQVPEAAAAFLEGIKGPRIEPPRVPIINIMHREGQFLLPTGEMVTEVSGYPLYYYQTRRYYKKPPTPGAKGAPPDCWSADCIKPSEDGVDIQADSCAACPNSKFGTGRSGSGQACSTQTWVFLYHPGSFGRSPIAAVVFPPSSIRALLGTKFEGGYFSAAADRHYAYEVVWTTIRLEQMGDQVQYSVAKPVMGPAIDNREDAIKLRDFRNQFVAVMEAMRGQTVDVATSPEE